MNPLDQLEDIIAPTQVSIWPLAWGWWLCIALLILVIASLIYVTLAALSARKARKQALMEIRQLENSDPQFAAKLHGILRRVTSHYYPHSLPAATLKNQWMIFLLEQLPDSKRENFKMALSSIYSSLYDNNTRLDPDVAKQQVVLWIKAATPTRLTSTPSKQETSHV